VTIVDRSRPVRYPQIAPEIIVTMFDSLWIPKVAIVDRSKYVRYPQIAPEIVVTMFDSLWIPEVAIVDRSRYIDIYKLQYVLMMWQSYNKIYLYIQNLIFTIRNIHHTIS
jgi:hypothetical protein